MGKLHSLLKRQLKKIFGNEESVPHICQALVEVVNEAYKQSDVDRAMLERSLDISSQEMLKNVADIRQAKAVVEASQKRLSSLYDSMTEAVCEHEVVYDESGKAVNYRMLSINKQYADILNLKAKDVVGKLATEAYGVPEAPYLENYAKVADTGKPFHFETYFPPMDKHFSISVFSPGKGKFATVFTDITERKLAGMKLEEKVKELEEFNQLAVGRELKMMELEKEIKQLKSKK